MSSHKNDLAANEYILYTHYGAFESFVKMPPDSSLVPPSPRQAKSRERLHRMPRAPFIELSVDVYDELQRRQAIAAAKDAGLTPTVPDALAPQDGLHPKRNTTREHLAVLQSSRFRDLVLDVYFEVARRLSQQQSETGAARNANPQVIPPAGPLPKVQSQVTAPAQRPATTGNHSSGHSSSNSTSSNGESRVYGRPVPKTFQTSTVVPTKSSMIERSDDSGDDELAGSTSNWTRSTQPTSSAPSGVQGKPVLHQRNTSQDSSRMQNIGQPSSTPAHRSPPNHNRVPTSTTSLHDHSRQPSEKDVTELSTQFASLRDKHAALQVESTSLKNEISELKTALEQKEEQVRFLTEALENEKQTAAELASSTEGEIFRTRAANMKMSAEIQVLEAEFEKLRTRSTVQSPVGNSVVDIDKYDQLKQTYDDLLAGHEILKAKLQDQHEVTEQVRTEALKFIGEMKALSELETANRDRTERLLSQVKKLQTENNELREKLALGQTGDILSMPDRKGLTTRPSQGAVNSFVSDDGVISLVYFARFQASIDALVRASAYANEASGQSYFFEMIRSVVTNTRYILTEADAFEQPGAPMTATKLRSRVSIASNNLVVAAKNHVMSCNLSPLSVLDASVASLVGCVVDLVKAAKLKGIVPAAPTFSD
ncbi:uncharacterized protein V1513DRAFT_146438 [Lipomyces chichibuensis]|uniref:uncharacterized protein n=1 Tax=Lipomyces chichibuensis TaxID=1546026 RepID=UPI0033432B85